MAPSLHAAVAALLAETEPFDALSDDERHSLLQKLTVEFYAPGEVILQQGDDIHRALYVVTEGLVRLQEGATSRTVDMCGPGSQFGAYGIVQGGALPYEAQAVEDTSCALIAVERFQALLKSNEEFKAYFEADIKRYVRSLDEDIDASGAFLLFDTTLGGVLRGTPPTVEVGATVRQAAVVMADADTDSVVIVRRLVAGSSLVETTLR